MSYEEGQGISKTARDLNISKSALYRWGREYGQNPEAAFPGKVKMSDKDAEIARLRRALKEAQMEAEILKKATAIYEQIDDSRGPGRSFHSTLGFIWQTTP